MRYEKYELRSGRFVRYGERPSISPVRRNTKLMPLNRLCERLGGDNGAIAQFCKSNTFVLGHCWTMAQVVEPTHGNRSDRYGAQPGHVHWHICASAHHSAEVARTRGLKNSWMLSGDWSACNRRQWQHALILVQCEYT